MNRRCLSIGSVLLVAILLTALMGTVATASTLFGTRFKLGETIAHELGHYLDLEHDDAEDNLMFRTTGRTDNKLTWDQWNTIRQHGMMKWLAPDI